MLCAPQKEFVLRAFSMTQRWHSTITCSGTRAYHQRVIQRRMLSSARCSHEEERSCCCFLSSSKSESMSFRMLLARAWASATSASRVRRASLLLLEGEARPRTYDPVWDANWSSWYAIRRRAFGPRWGANSIPSPKPMAPLISTLQNGMRVVFLSDMTSSGTVRMNTRKKRS